MSKKERKRLARGAKALQAVKMHGLLKHPSGQISDVPGLVLPDETVPLPLPLPLDELRMLTPTEDVTVNVPKDAIIGEGEGLPAQDVISKIMQAHSNIHSPKMTVRGARVEYAPVGNEWVSVGRNKKSVDLTNDQGKITHHLNPQEAVMYVRKKDMERIRQMKDGGVDVTDPTVEVQFVVGPQKRKPILLDLVVETIRRNGLRLAETEKISQAVFDETVASAKKFVLDDEASRYLAHYERDHPEKIALANEYAIPPFKRMWLEFNNEVHYSTITGNAIEDDGAVRKGYLLDGRDVMVFVEHGTGSISMNPFMICLNSPATLENELEVCRLLGVSRIQLDALMWGHPHAFIQAHHPDLLRVFRENHSLVPGVRKMYEVPDGYFYEHGQEWAGDMRTLIAALAFLNRTQDMQVIEEKKAKPGLIMRKPRAYVGHSVITLKLNPIERLKRIGASGPSGPKRLHDVRGHYCRNKASKIAEELGDTCQRLDMEDPLFYLTCHDWKELEGSKHVDQKTGAIMTWKCTRCKGSLWRKPEHQRGTLKQGVVVQRYAVTA